MTIDGSTLTGNVAGDGGGVGILREDPGTMTVTIRNSTLSGNSATGGTGGGIYNEARNAGSIADVSLTNCTLSGNSAAPPGFTRRRRRRDLQLRLRFGQRSGCARGLHPQRQQRARRRRHL